MNEREMWAEKTRAALCRRAPAIRDFFDLDHARKSLGLDLEASDFMDLIRKKLAVPGNEHMNLSVERRADLTRQVEGQLRPVLRASDFEAFDLDRVWNALVAAAERLRHKTA